MNRRGHFAIVRPGLGVAEALTRENFFLVQNGGPSWKSLSYLNKRGWRGR
jgi:hypothetical protein